MESAKNRFIFVFICLFGCFNVCRSGMLAVPGASEFAKGAAVWHDVKGLGTIVEVNFDNGKASFVKAEFPSQKGYAIFIPGNLEQLKVVDSKALPQNDIEQDAEMSEWEKKIYDLEEYFTSTESVWLKKHILNFIKENRTPNNMDVADMDNIVKTAVERRKHHAKNFDCLKIWERMVFWCVYKNNGALYKKDPEPFMRFIKKYFDKRTGTILPARREEIRKKWEKAVNEKVVDFFERRLVPARKKALVENLDEYIDSIELAVQGEGIFAIASDKKVEDVLQRDTELVANYLSYIRFEIVVKVKKLLDKGFLPYETWVMENYKDLHRVAIRDDVFGSWQVLLRCIKVPDILLGFSGCGGVRINGARRGKMWLNKQIKDLHESGEDLGFESMMENHAAILLNAIKYYATWPNAVYVNTGLLIDILKVPDFTSEDIEETASVNEVPTTIKNIKGNHPLIARLKRKIRRDPSQYSL